MTNLKTVKKSKVINLSFRLAKNTKTKTYEEKTKPLNTYLH